MFHLICWYVTLWVRSCLGRKTVRLRSVFSSLGECDMLDQSFTTFLIPNCVRSCFVKCDASGCWTREECVSQNGKLIWEEIRCGLARKVRVVR